MKETKKQNQTTKFLVVSFIGLLIFSVLVFTVLGVFMSKKSTQAVYEVGNLYMGGIGEQLSKHFETTIELRFEQMDGLAEVVTTENFDTIEDLYTELAYRAQIRKFAYLALCSENGDFETMEKERIMDCIECRCCEYICSSKIPLVTKIKAGKNAVRGMK